MASEPTRPTVRVRTRKPPGASDQRLVADPAPPARKKRQPNSGSMKPGETRNPNGRPKGAKGTKAMARKVLSTKTTIKDGGVTRKVSLYHALLLKEMERALAGDWRARKMILELGRWALPEEDPFTSASSPVNEATDQAILEWFEEEVRASVAGEDKENDMEEEEEEEDDDR